MLEASPWVIDPDEFDRMVHEDSRRWSGVPVSESGLREHREVIGKWLDIAVLTAGTADSRTARVVLEDLVAAHESLAQKVAVRRQGQVIEAAIRGDLTVFDSEPRWDSELR